MASISFYLDVPYKKGSNIKKYKASGKPIPVSLLNDSPTSIYCILTLSKKEINQSRAKLIKVKTNFRILPRNWNFKTKMPNDQSLGALELKAELGKIYLDVFNKYVSLSKREDELSITIIDLEITKSVEGESNLINVNDLFDIFENKFLLQNPTIKTERTRQKFRTLIKNLRSFEEDKKYRVGFDSINEDFFHKYITYLETEVKNPKSGEKGFLNNTINKYVSDFKGFLEWAYDKKYHKNKFYEELIYSRDEVEPVSLEIEEFRALLDHRPSTDALKDTQDCFIAECLTSQRYEDMANMKWEDIRNGIWYLFQAKGRKTRVLEIPLHPLIVKILERRKGKDKPLPVISNQKYNDNIKELCKEAEITETYTRVRYSGDKAIKEVGPKNTFVSSHTGRKTFQNIAPEFGISIEVAMSISGSKDMKVIMEHYRKVSLKEKSKAIKSMNFKTKKKQ
jgi:integrase